ncbi:MAG: redoxin domain-containing protein [Rhodospirillales bacterium]|nr:redoxin domain-containing protein [Rhodospirillales bacterium]
MLKPTQPVPSLSVPLVGGGRFDIAGSPPKTFTLIAVYRGYHCPICRPWLGSLVARLDSLAALGIAPVAISTDAEDRATKARDEWKLVDLPVGYALSIDVARAWGLSISSSITEKEPPLFAEPGVFLVRPDATLFGASVQTMPFTRPSFADIETAVRFVLENNYPPRGTA